METQHIIHNFDPIYNEHSKILMLGTMPSPKSREVYIPFRVNHLHGQTEPVPRRMRATLTETEPVLFDANYQATVC